MRSFIVLSGFFLFNLLYSGGPAYAASNQAQGTVNSRAALAMSVTQEASEEQRIADVLENYAPLASYLSAVAGTQIKVGYSRNMSAELQRTRTASVDILVGPAHIIGSALRYGYEPLATFSSSEKMVFVVSEASTIKVLEDARGKRLGLPSADSLAAYLALGDFNARGLQLKAYFQQIRNFSSHDVVLYALGMGTIDVAVVEYRVAEKWLSANKGRVIHETKSVPSIGIALNAALDKGVKQKIRDALLSPNPKRPAFAQLASVGIVDIKPATEEDYRYVSTLGYFTPMVLPGIKMITAEDVQDLMSKGVPLYDVRIEQEYKEKHIKGALPLTYAEKSKKEVGYDAAQDQFKLAETVKDKDAPMIFACNGGECWKSYKASVWAQNMGYRNVYWYRGGFPDWKAKNLPME
ncbi:MAG TPA: PhnD/SsuA/transferrin family substrate-binding protein [Burkholderiales bacterium]|nr:PhnD/SsuA/transferrin family substrate-binding protein [Burkholderiales bacterium]